MTEPTPFAPRRFGRGVLYAVAGHVVIVLVAWLASLLVTPSPGGGFEDLAAVAIVLVGGEAVFGLTCLVGGSLQFRRGQRELGLGLVVGWVVGLAALVLFTKVF